jgi:DNA-binding MarR family transcriptional regulator
LKKKAGTTDRWRPAQKHHDMTLFMSCHELNHQQQKISRFAPFDTFGLYPIRDPMPPTDAPKPGKSHLTALSEFRHGLRRFLRFSEDAAHEAGITTLQYQLLIHIAGMPGREWATVGELAELLQAKPNGVVALVSRCEEAGLVRRKPGRQDRRQVEIHLLAKGRNHLDKLAMLHLEQVQLLADAIEALRREMPAAPSKRN